MDSSALSFINIILGVLLILLNAGAFFLFENIKENINDIQIKLSSYSVPITDVDRVLSYNYFLTKIKFYKMLVSLFTGLYGAGGILLGFSLLVNAIFLYNNAGINSNLTYIIPIFFEFFILLIIPYFYFVKIKPCKE